VRQSSTPEARPAAIPCKRALPRIHLFASSTCAWSHQ
jgi:hypothetical protein